MSIILVLYYIQFEASFVEMISMLYLQIRLFPKLVDIIDSFLVLFVSNLLHLQNLKFHQHNRLPAILKLLILSISFSETNGAGFLLFYWLRTCKAYPLPSSCSAPCSPRIVLLSILEVTWKDILVGKFALIVP